MTQTAGLKATPLDLAPTSRAGLVGAAILALIVVAMYFDFIRNQVLWATREPSDWGHTLVVPGIAAWLAYRNRERILSKPFRTNWLGLLAIFIGVCWYIVCLLYPGGTLNHLNIKSVGVMMTLGGIVLLFTGWRVTLLMMFPLLYLAVFGQTISERLLEYITLPLQHITARGAAFVLGAFVETERNYNTIIIHLSDGTSRPLNVAEACSGMRMLMAFLALGVAMAYVGLRHNWQRFVLVALGVPVAVLVNILRVVSLSALSIYNPNFAAGDVHSFIGVIWLIPAFFLYLGLMWVIRNLFVETEPPPSHNPSVPETAMGFVDAIFARLDRRAPLALIAACATLLLSFVGVQAAVAKFDYYLRKEPVPLRQNLVRIPKELGTWRATGIDRRLDAAVVEELGTEDYLNRVYIDESSHGQRAIQLHIAYYTGMIDAVPHVPDRCFVASGLESRSIPANMPLAIPTESWRPDEARLNADGEPYLAAAHRDDIYGRTIDVRMPFGDFLLRTTEFGNADAPQRRIFAGYNFLANGHMVGTPLEIRARAFDLSSRYAYYCKVQFTMQGGPELDRDGFIEAASDLYTHLLPELMRCLPDWADVESKDDDDASVVTSNPDLTTAD